MTARERQSYCVYTMGSLSGTLYIGFTGNLHKRVFEHKFHQREGFTNKYDVERLLYWASYDDVHPAIAREKQLKGWSRTKQGCADRVQKPPLARPSQGLVPVDETFPSVILSGAEPFANANRSAESKDPYRCRDRQRAPSFPLKLNA